MLKRDKWQERKTDCARVYVAQSRSIRNRKDSPVERKMYSKNASFCWTNASLAILAMLSKPGERFARIKKSLIRDNLHNMILMMIHIYIYIYK